MGFWGSNLGKASTFPLLLQPHGLSVINRGAPCSSLWNLHVQRASGLPTEIGLGSGHRTKPQGESPEVPSNLRWGVQSFQF